MATNVYACGACELSSLKCSREVVEAPEIPLAEESFFFLIFRPEGNERIRASRLKRKREGGQLPNPRHNTTISRQSKTFYKLENSSRHHRTLSVMCPLTYVSRID